MRAWVRRGLVVPAAVVAGAAVAVMLAVHTPWARGLALRRASDFVTRYELALDADSLRYNLFTRRITLTGVRLAARGHEERPFLTAERIEANLPWMVYRGRFEIDQLDITRGVVDIHRDVRDVANLPPSSGGPPLEIPRRLTVHGLALHGLDLKYEDMLRDWSLHLPRIDADLKKATLGAEGAFVIGGNPTVRIGARTLTLAPIDTVMTFDGSNVSLQGARLVAPELNATLSGPIRRVLDTAALDLSLNGVVHLAHAARWVPPPPVPVNGTLTIDGSVSGPLGGSVVRLAVTSHDLSIGREAGIGLVGPVIVTSDATFGEGLVLTPQSGGEIRAAFSVPWGSAPPSSARATWRGLDAQAALRLGDFESLPIGAALAGAGTFAFGDVPRYTARNQATARARRRLVAVSGTLEAGLAGDEYTIRHAHRVEGLIVEGDTAGRIDRDDLPLTTLSGPLRAHVLDVADAARSLEALGIEMPAIAHEIRGAIDVPVTITGSFRDSAVEGPVSGAVDVPLVGVVRVASHVASNTREVTISEIDVRRGSAILQGTAVGNITAGTWSGALRLEAPRGTDVQDAVPEAWRIHGPVAATATLSGTFDAVRLDTRVTGGAFTWADQSFDAFTAALIATPTDVDVTSLHVTHGTGAVDGRLTYAFDTGAYRASVKGHTLAWNGSVLSPNDTHAGFSMEFDGAGTIEKPFGQARVDFALTGGAAGALVDAGRVTVDLQGDVARLAAQLPSLGATVTGEVDTASPYDYRATAVLDRLDVARLATLGHAVEGQILGFASGQVTASGRLADAGGRTATLDLQTVDVGIGGVPVSLNAPARVSVRGTDVTVDSLDMRIGAGRLTASGEWTTAMDGQVRGSFDGDFQDVIRMGRAVGLPETFDGTGPLAARLESTGTRAGTTAALAITDGTFSWGAGPAAVRHLNVDAALTGEEFTLSRIGGSVASGGVVGTFSAHASARLTALALAAIDGELVVDDARFTFSGLPVAQQRPSRFRFADGTVAATDVEWSVANNAIRLSGSAGVAAADPPIDLSVQGLVDLRVLSAFAPTVAFDGTAELDVRVGGVMSTPVLGGQIVLAAADIAVYEPRLVLSELSGPITLSGQTILLEDIRGFANGGTIALDGVLRIADFAVAGGVVNIQAQAVALELAKGLRSEVDALIIFRPDPTAPSLTGDVRIVQSSYTDTITIASLARRLTLPVTPMVQRPFLDRLRLNLAVTTTEDTTVDNNYGRLEAGTELRIVGTVAEPGANGRITLREGGEVFLAGRTFRITRGDISFSNLRRIQPEFNIAAEARIDDNDVTMALTGRVDRPELDVTSAGGSTTPGELAAAIVGTNNTETALTLLSADLLGVTGRAIGLDTFRVERGEYLDRDFQEDTSLVGTSGFDPTTRLTIAKRLSDQVAVTVSQNLRESGKTTVIVSYLPGRNVEVRALSRDNATISVGIRHEITFGSGAGTPAVERRVRAVVSAIRFVGVDPDVEAEARQHVRLEPGDAFDFLVLQRDTDRLREAFHRQGFLEARIRTRRVEDPAANTLILEYRIERGPHTTIEVTGVTLPAGERDALEEAWGRNTFDQFLIDDLTNRVRRYLVTQNELASVVVGTIERPTPDQKRVRIDVTPGVPVTGREIRFTGHPSVRKSVLDNVLSAAGLELEAWIDRTVVEREVLGLYHGMGYLKAQVKAGPLDVDGTVGVLPVSIVEGPRAVVTAVTWAGVADERIEAARKAAAVTPPAPFVGAEINDARRRVERQYRADGFNSVEVNVEPRFADDDTVGLVFNVVEGSQQVLREVVTAGTHRTRDHVIREALRFELGKPVDLDEWARARKRLYDTNVFRQVDIEALPDGEVVDGVQPVRANVTVVEYPSWSFRYGAQLESERQADFEEFTSTRNLGAVAEIKNPNLFGRALTGGLFGQYERLRQDATVFLATSRLFGWRARSSLYGYFSRDRIKDTGDVLAAVTDREGVSVDQRWRVAGFQVVYGYRFERNRTFDPDPAVSDPFPLDFTANLARLSGAVLFDRRDDPLNSRKGTFTSVSWDHAALWLGSDVSNRKLLMQQYAFVPVGPRVVLASRVQSGFVFGRDDLLPSDRFLAGGATTVRGYAEDSLGPRDFLGLPTGGETLVVLNQEVRFPIYRWIQGVGFVDAGNIAGRGESAWRGLAVGYGIGLRFDTPAGLLRVDYGIPRASPSAAGSTTGRWYFGFGHIF